MKTKSILKRTSRRSSAAAPAGPGDAAAFHPDDARDLDSVLRPVVVRARDYPAAHLVPRHRHRRAQFLYASEGVMTVTTAKGVWVVPPQRAVWIPALVEHEVKATGPLRIRNVYLAPGAGGLPADCRVVPVSPLLRQLILAAAERPRLYDEAGPDGRLMAVLADQIRAATGAAVPLHLPLPRDRRLQRIALALTADPADGRSLAQWAAEAGASARTLGRRFVAETGLTFGHWRQQARLLAALTRLGRGEAVTTVALDLGYASQSAFIAMFRRALGTTPGRYFARPAVRETTTGEIG